MTPLPIKAKISGNFLSRIKARQVAWSATTKLGARLHLPDGMEWVYYHEVGTFGPYPIPTMPTGVAYLDDNGVLVKAAQVFHPGVKATHMIQNTMPEIDRASAEAVQEAFIAGAADNPATLQGKLEQATEEAKNLITQSISQSLPGTKAFNAQFPKQSGKLKGATAAEVFNEQAEVIPLSSF
jgi:hypothetical protein